MASNYSSWTLAKLEKERDKIDRAIKTKQGVEKKSVIAEIRKIARKSGFDVSELFDGESSTASAPKRKVRGKKKSSGRYGKVKPKYRNPADASETWTGRGRTPLWMQAQLEKGRKKEDFLI